MAKWVALSSALFGLLLLTFLVVPYWQATFYINRQTGLQSVEQRAYYFYKTNHPIAVPINGMPLNKVPLTAPNREMIAQIRQCRFPWSDVEDLLPQHGEGWDYAKAYYLLFCFDSGNQIHDFYMDKITTDRVSIWNSAAMDNDIQGVIKRAMVENEKFVSMYKNMKVSGGER